MTRAAVENGGSLFVIIIAALVAVSLLLLLLQRRRLVRRAPRSSTLERRREARPSRQVAAVPVRRGPDGRIEVLVISTRGSARWTVPKGWPMRGRSDAEAAAQEAYEEAGVRGRVAPEPIGAFAYAKRRDDRQKLYVTVYRLDVDRRVRRFRERGERRRRWLPAEAAADCVAWPKLADIIRSL